MTSPVTPEGRDDGQGEGGQSEPVARRAQKGLAVGRRIRDNEVPRPSLFPDSFTVAAPRPGAVSCLWVALSAGQGAISSRASVRASRRCLWRAILSCAGRRPPAIRCDIRGGRVVRAVKSAEISHSSRFWSGTGGNMDELLNRYRCKTPIVGSNPIPSANSLPVTGNESDRS